MCWVFSQRALHSEAAGGDRQLRQRRGCKSSELIEPITGRGDSGCRLLLELIKENET